MRDEDDCVSNTLSVTQKSGKITKSPTRAEEELGLKGTMVKFADEVNCGPRENNLGPERVIGEGFQHSNIVEPLERKKKGRCDPGRNGENGLQYCGLEDITLTVTSQNRGTTSNVLDSMMNGETRMKCPKLKAAMRERR